MRRTIVLMAAALLASAGSVRAGTATWSQPSGTNDWFDPASWTPSAVPGAGDDVVITNSGAFVFLTNSTAGLASFTISNRATLVFSNWGTALSAESVWIMSSAVVTCAGPFSSNEMSNAVVILATSVWVGVGGGISVDGRGYRSDGGGAATAPSSGPGGAYYRGGGSHGGRGGYVAESFFLEAGLVNGSASAPVTPGSGGGSSGGGHGGGVVRVDAADGTITVNGSITARGANRSSGTYVGAGAGGSIHITCGTFAGAGMLNADGGNAAGSLNGGGGGGGRIAVVYDTAAQAALPVPGATFSVAGGAGTSTGMWDGTIGSLYFTDARFLTPRIRSLTGQIVIPGFTNWVVPGLEVTNVAVRFVGNGFTLSASNDVVVTGAKGRLELGGNMLTRGDYYPYSAMDAPPRLLVGGNLVVRDRARLYMYGAATNSGGPGYGGLVAVAGQMTVGSNSWVYPFAHNTNGGIVVFRVGDLVMQGGFNADAAGWLWRYGNRGLRGSAAPAGGAGYYRGGGGYGGEGGYVASSLDDERGLAYGDSNAPSLPGSGGGSGYGGKGGGAIWIECARSAYLAGTMSASGGTGGSQYSGGGAGGAIYVACARLYGTGAVLRAAGGNGISVNGGGGGGGRVAVWRGLDRYSGIISNNVAGGFGTATNSFYFGQPGTVVYGFLRLPPPGLLILSR